MLTSNHYPDYNFATPNDELLEIHRSKISLHHAKAGYDYPVVRLPHKFSRLAGLPTRIYQTVHEGAPAFLVVVPQSGDTDQNELKENAAESPKRPVDTLP